MPLPYDRATAGGDAIEATRKLLMNFGCTRFGHMTDMGEGVLILQFSYRGRDVEAKASFKGYAAAWLKEHPHKSAHRCTTTEYQKRAMKQAEISVCSILRDWIKGQVVAIETGILSFEGAFLGQLLLGSGQTVLEHVQAQKMLAIPTSEGTV